MGRGCDRHRDTSHTAFPPPCRKTDKRHMKTNYGGSRGAEPSPELPMKRQLLRAPARAPRLLSGHLSPSLLSPAAGPSRAAQREVLSSFLSSLFLPPRDFFPRCRLQGERGRRRQNERFSCVPSPSSGPNSFFMAPRSDKSRRFSLVSVRRAISQS